jgi:hypothetical protein
MRAVGCIGLKVSGLGAWLVPNFSQISCQRLGVQCANVMAMFQDIALDFARNYFFDQAFYAAITDTPLS